MTKPELDAWIAGRACEALASLSALYDESGMEAEMLMCAWTGAGDGAGEAAAQRVVKVISDMLRQTGR